MADPLLPAPAAGIGPGELTPRHIRRVFFWALGASGSDMERPFDFADGFASARSLRFASFGRTGFRLARTTPAISRGYCQGEKTVGFTYLWHREYKRLFVHPVKCQTVSGVFYGRCANKHLLIAE